MDLKKFISQSLTEIMEGIKEAQDNLAGSSHGRVCPTFQHFEKNDHVIGENVGGRPITLVEYDVAVEASSEVGAGGGIKVLGGIIGGKLGGDMKDVDKVVTRIKFNIPIVYPDIAEN